MTRVYERLGSLVLPRELEDIGLESTLQCDPYENKTQNEQTFPQLAEKPELMPEVGDHNIGVEIQLLRGDEMARGHVVAWSCNTNGIAMGRLLINPILYTRMYHVEFAGSKFTELTTNIIAELVYAQCNADGNESLPLDELFDQHKDNNMVPCRTTYQYMGQTSNP